MIKVNQLKDYTSFSRDGKILYTGKAETMLVSHSLLNPATGILRNKLIHSEYIRTINEGYSNGVQLKFEKQND